MAVWTNPIIIVHNKHYTKQKNLKILKRFSVTLNKLFLFNISKICRDNDWLYQMLVINLQFAERPRMQSNPPPRFLGLPPLRPLPQQETIPPQVLRPMHHTRSAVRAHPKHDSESGICLRRAPRPGEGVAAAARVPRSGRGHVEGRQQLVLGWSFQVADCVSAVGVEVQVWDC